MLSEQDLGILKAKVKPLIEAIRRTKKMSVVEIASAIGYENRLSSFYKWATSDKHSPKDFLVQDVVAQLEKLLETPGTGKRTTTLICIYLDVEKKTELYTGEDRAIGIIININGYHAIIAHLDNTLLTNNADGFIYMHDAGAEPGIKYGSLIAIRKINREDWRPGYFYLVIDTSQQLFIRKLIAGRNNDEVTLISENENMYPSFTLRLTKITSIFRVEKVIGDP